MDDKFVRLNLRREHFPKFAGLKLPHDLTVAVKASGVTMVAKPMNVIYDDKDPQCWVVVGGATFTIEGDCDNVAGKINKKRK
jgi:hypothetical protein